MSQAKAQSEARPHFEPLRFYVRCLNFSIKIEGMEAGTEHPIFEPIEVFFDKPPLLEKAPPCPSGFVWRDERFQVVELLSEWRDYQRRGRMGRNMQPEHARIAAVRGSWGVGRFHFVVRVENDRIFEIYYDRAPGRAGERKGSWYMFAERVEKRE